MPKGKTVEVTMKSDKVCKSCVRFRGEGKGADEVGSSFYLQNDAYEKLGQPKKIVMTISLPT